MNIRTSHFLFLYMYTYVERYPNYYAENECAIINCFKTGCNLCNLSKSKQAEQLPKRCFRTVGRNTELPAVFSEAKDS